jgi:hypothetical protein
VYHKVVPGIERDVRKCDKWQICAWKIKKGLTAEVKSRNVEVVINCNREGMNITLLG